MVHIFMSEETLAQFTLQSPKVKPMVAQSMVVLHPQSNKKNELEDLFYQNKRYLTFGGVGKWFETGPANKRRMAKSGLFVPENEDGQQKTVKCIYCRHVFKNWKRTEDPAVRHLKESPDCKFAHLGKDEEDITIKDLFELFCYSALKNSEEKYKRTRSAIETALEKQRNVISEN